MNIKVVLCLCLLSMLIVGSVSAYTELTFDSSPYTTTEISYNQALFGYGARMSIYPYNLSQISSLTGFKYYPSSNNAHDWSFTYNVDDDYLAPSAQHLEAGANVNIGTCTCQFVDGNPSGGEYLDCDTTITSITGLESTTLFWAYPINWYQYPNAVSDTYYINTTSQGGLLARNTNYRMEGTLVLELGDYPIIDIEPNADYQLTNHNIVFSDLSTGFDITEPYPTYSLTFGDGWSDTGSRTSNGLSWSHSYNTAGNYTVTLTITQSGVQFTDTCTVEIIDDTTCNYDISLSASKQYGIMPFNYINTTISITGSPALGSGSAIGYKTEPQTGTSASDIMYAYFYNNNGTWTYTRNDLGNFTTGTTTYDDALSEQVRFGASGYYKIKAAVMPVDQCTKTDEIELYVNPTSGVNLYVNFYDGITFNHLNENVHSIAKIVGITDNQSYYGNPLTLDTQIGYNVSIWAEADGYQDKHIYYTVPYPPSGGTVLEIPFYMFPENFGEWYPGNTTWNIFVKNKGTGEPIYGAYCRAVDSVGVAIDSDFTNGQGYLSLQIPYREGAVRLDVDKIPYVAQSQWVNLGNATTYETTVYLQWSGTPTPTPSYNYTYTVTPTQTDTQIPTVTQITNPMLTVWARDAITNLPIGDAYVYIYDGDEIDQTYKGMLIYSSTTDSVQGATHKFQMTANNAYWIVVSKSGYYTLEKRFRMSSQDASIFAPLQPSTGVTVATTHPTLVLPTPGGSGIQGGFIGWILDYFAEWFGVDAGTARILLALFIIMCSAVFVGGSLAGFGSGAGAGMGALIGGMFAFIAMCYVQFLPFWLLPIGIAFVGMAFFVWNRQEN